MFEKLGQLKDLWKLKSQMEELKKRLDGMVVKVEGPKHWVEITISGSQEIKEVKIFDIAKEATRLTVHVQLGAVFFRRLCRGFPLQTVGLIVGNPKPLRGLGHGVYFARYHLSVLRH